MKRVFAFCALGLGIVAGTFSPAHATEPSMGDQTPSAVLAEAVPPAGMKETDASARPKEARKEIYVPAGFALFSGGTHLFAGVGGGIGFRYDLDSIWTVYSEAKANYYAGASGTLAIGVSGRFVLRSYRPELGVSAVLFVGEDIRILDSRDATLAPPVAVAITTRIAPLRFVRGRYAASALTVDVGCGIDTRSRCALALSVNLLEAGLRF